MPLNDAGWKSRLPGLIATYVRRWELRLGEPYASGSVSFVAPATTADGTDAVFKLSIPDREAVGEADALRWWNGRGAVRLLNHDPDNFALLVERCRPGLPLGGHTAVPAESRLRVAAELLAGLWRTGVPGSAPFERVGDVTAEWADLAERRMRELRPPYDPALVARGVDLLRTLPTTAERRVVVHGDFNPGNILSRSRSRWLVIDPKPMVGDPGYDLCPLIMLLDSPFRYADPAAVLDARFKLVAEVVGEPVERLVAWSLARWVEAALWHASRSETAAGADKMAEAATAAALIDEIR